MKVSVENTTKIEATIYHTNKINGERVVTEKTVGSYGISFSDCVKKLEKRLEDIEDYTGVFYGIKGEVRIAKTETTEVEYIENTMAYAL